MAAMVIFNLMNTIDRNSSINIYTQCQGTEHNYWGFHRPSTQGDMCFCLLHQKGGAP